MTDQSFSYALGQDLSEENIPLDRLFLDPNNPRFIGSDWQDVPDEKTREPAIQQEARRRLIERFDVEKLRLNMEINGYLPIDRVVVRRLSDEAYVVLEGNRRICAAKELKRIADRDDSIHEDIRESVARIPTLVYLGNDQEAAWTFQGLRHITGINDWPAFNKARLLVTKMEEEGLSLTAAGQRFGLSAFGAGQWARGYYAFQQVETETDYAEEIDERCYPFLQELFGRSSIAIREWIDWNEDDNRFRNTLRLNEFAGWLYPKPENPETDGTRGEWESRRLTVRDDLRRLSVVYRQDRDAFEDFRKGDLDVESAYSKVLKKQYEQSLDRVEEVFESIAKCRKVLEDVPFKLVTQAALRARLTEALCGLKNAVEEIEKVTT